MDREAAQLPARCQSAVQDLCASTSDAVDVVVWPLGVLFCTSHRHGTAAPLDQVRDRTQGGDGKSTARQHCCLHADQGALAPSDFRHAPYKSQLFVAFCF